MDANDGKGGRMLLGEILLARGLITKEQLEQALRIQVGGMRRVGSILIRMKVLEAESLTDALSQQLRLPVVNVDDEFHKDVRAVLPRYLCRKYSVIPLSRESNNVLRLAMADPLDSVAISDVENYTGSAVQPVLARLNEVDRAIPAHVAFSRQDLFNPQVYQTVARIAIGAVLVLLVITGLQVYRDLRIQRYGTVSHTGGSVIYKNHDLMIDVDTNESVFFSGRGAFANGYYGVRFENPQLLTTFVKGAQRQFSAEQFEWIAWVLREKLKVTEQILTAKNN